ncbi:MAG: hypothetical protein ACFE9C_16870, partial [Candidatus Hodarchaeota archaeon]
MHNQIEEDTIKTKKNFLDFIFSKKAILLIIIGILIRIFMLIYYYYTHAINPSLGWGDVGLNFNLSIYYPPLTTVILDSFRLISFGFV